MKKILLLTILFSHQLFAEEYAALTLPTVTLEGEVGGRLDGTAWSSNEIKEKFFVLFYVDPDEKDLNEPTADLLKKEQFPLEQYGSIGVINMAATWLPNFAIEASLKQKLKKFSDTLYLRDLKKVLVKKWGLKDDSSNILLFDKSGKLLFKIMGKATNEESLRLISIIKEQLAK